MNSEFGKGFVYNLVLFAKHWAYNIEYRKEQAKTQPDAFWYWFNGASDHLYELEIPKQWQKKKIGKLARHIQDTALKLGHDFASEHKATEKAYETIFEELEQLCLLIDKELGLKPIKADWK